MFGKYLFGFVYDVLHLPCCQAVTFCDLFLSKAIKQSKLQYVTVPFSISAADDPLIYYILYVIA